MTAAISEAVHAVDAVSVLGLFATRPRVLALGEPVHGEQALLGLRNELFRELVEEHGYRTVALEVDCLKALVVDDYVTTGTGTLDEAVRCGFSHGWGAFAGNRELVRWMRAYNEVRPASQWLRFAGVDGPLEITGAASPGPALTALHAYLAGWVDADLLACTAETLGELLGAEGRWTDPAAMRDPSVSVGRTPEAGRLRLLADDLVALLEAQAPYLVAVSSEADLDRAHLYGRTAVGLLRYHFWMADASPGRLSRMVGLRDSMMAANLVALAERGPVVVSAHNGHLQRHRCSMRMGGQVLRWWGAGAIVGARLGDGFVSLATAVGTITHRGVDVPAPHTVEGLLYALPQARCVVDTGRLVSILGDVPPAPRESAWYGYSPLDPAEVAGMDGIVFVRDVAAG
jgi:erythromycin esterase-like protein